MEKDFSKQFTKCPSCGSEDRFFELLGQETSGAFTMKSEREL